MHKSVYSNAYNLGVDTRRLTTKRLIVCGVVFLLALLLSSGVFFGNPPVGGQTIATPLASGGTEVTSYFDHGGYIGASFRSDRDLTNVSFTSANEERNVQISPDDGVGSGVYVNADAIYSRGYLRRTLNYTVEGPPDDVLFTASMPFENTTSTITVVGYQLTDIVCQIDPGPELDEAADTCDMVEVEPGVYRADIENSNGKNVRVSALRGAAVPDATAEVRPAPNATLLGGPFPLVRLGTVVVFAAIALWAVWQVRRGANQYRTPQGTEVSLSDRALAQRATPSLAIPADTTPARGRALANERFSLMVATSEVADLLSKGVLEGSIVASQPATFKDVLGARAQFAPNREDLILRPGPNHSSASEVDRNTADWVLGGHEQLSIKSDALELRQRIREVNKSLAEHVSQLSWWSNGNPTTRHVTPIRPLTLLPLSIAFAVVFFFSMLFAGLAPGVPSFIAFSAVNALALVIVFWALLIWPTAPRLTEEGSGRLVEIESLRQGLQNITTQQVLHFAHDGTLRTYAAWSVALNVPEVDDRIRSLLSSTHGSDPRLIEAAAISVLVRNWVRACMGINTIRTQFGYISSAPQGAGTTF